MNNIEKTSYKTTGSKISDSVKNTTNDRKENFMRESALLSKVILLFACIFLFVGCAEEEQTIDGMNFGVENERIKNARQMKFEEENKEKYLRHFNKEVYDEDWTSIEKELNAKFNQDLRERIDFLMRTKEPNEEKLQYILKTEVEYVREDMRKYRDKELRADNILTNPKSIMSMKIYFYGFGNPMKTKEVRNYQYSDWESFIYMVIGYDTLDRYPRDGVEVFEFYYKLYDKELLKKYTMEEIEQQKDINIFLAEEDGEGSGFMLKTPYYITESFYDDGGCGILSQGFPEKKVTQMFEKKYDVPAYHYFGNFCGLKKYPGEFAYVHYYPDSEVKEDYYLGMLYQYLMNQRLKQMVEEAGLSDRVAFLVRTEPGAGSTGREYSTNKRDYPLGDDFDEAEFLKNGFAKINGTVSITLLYLKSEEEKIDYPKLRGLIKQISDEIQLGKFENDHLPPEQRGIGEQKLYVYYYDIDEHGRKVVIDLFEQYPMTERDMRSEDLSMAEFLSIDQHTRAETPGIHYLDMFAQPTLRLNRHGLPLDQEYDVFIGVFLDEMLYGEEEDAIREGLIKTNNG